MTIENIKELMDGVDIAALLPDIQSILDLCAVLARYGLLLGPIVMLFLGLHYFLLAPKEANYTTGYRFRWGMASVESWRFMQQVAGAIWSLLGLGLLIAMAVATQQMKELELMALLLQVIHRVLWQAGLALVSSLLINLIVVLRYDHTGKRRLTWRELYRP